MKLTREEIEVLAKIHADQFAVTHPDEDWHSHYYGFQASESMVIHNKPPLGLTPKYIHDQQRQNEIIEAIERYIEAGKKIPKEWAIEFASYCV